MRSFRRSLLLAIALLAASCIYDVPISPTPSRHIEPRLIGLWTAKGDDGTVEHMTVREWDADHYAVQYDGAVYRAFHTDVAGLPLLSVQDLNTASRKYLYATWSLSSDGQRLKLRAVRTEVVPETMRDSAAIAKLIEKNRDNPELFNEGAVYTREKPGLFDGPGGE